VPSMRTREFFIFLFFIFFPVRADALMYLLFSLGAGNANGRLMEDADGSISLTKLPIPIFEVIMIGFRHSFFFMDRHVI
jgi:hypothetical protein